MNQDQMLRQERSYEAAFTAALKKIGLERGHERIEDEKLFHAGYSVLRDENTRLRKALEEIRDSSAEQKQKAYAKNKDYPGGLDGAKEVARLFEVFRKFAAQALSAEPSEHVLTPPVHDFGSAHCRKCGITPETFHASINCGRRPEPSASEGK